MFEIIFNPGSRSNVSSSIWDSVKMQLEKQNIEYRLHITKKANHAESIAGELTADGCPHDIIVIGGDGTLNEVLNGIEFPELVNIGLIPSGSGNDFARSVGIPLNPQKALNVIINTGKATAVNYGEALTPYVQRRFLISCGCGFDSDVCHDVQVSKIKPILNRIGLGKLSYTLIALKKLIKKSTFSAVLRIDKQALVTLEQLFFMTVMNTKHEGGGYMFCPEASPSDDLLDFLTVNNLPRRQIIPLLPKAKKGTHMGHKGIDITKISSVKMKLSKSVYLHTDGEIIGKFDHIVIKCADSYVNFYLPDTANI